MSGMKLFRINFCQETEYGSRYEPDADAESNPLRVIEFFGLPGSGKSTLADELTENVRADGRCVISRHEMLADERYVLYRHMLRFRFVFYAALLRLGLLFRSAQLIAHDGQTSTRQFLKVCWNMWCVLGWYLWLQRKASNEAVVIVDQGLAQAAWSVKYTSLRATVNWSNFFKNAGLLPQKLVVVTCPPEIAKTRLLSREKGYSRLSDVGVDKQAWQRSHGIFAQLQNDLREQVSLTVVDNSGAQSISSIVQLLENRIFSD